MKKVIGLWNKIDKPLRIAFYISVVYLLLYEGVLKDIPAPNKFFFKLSEFGIVFIQILYALVTGFIFYFFFEFIEQDKRKGAVHLLLWNHSVFMNSEISSFINEICLKNNAQIGTKISQDNFFEICKNTSVFISVKNRYFREYLCGELLLSITKSFKEKINDILLFQQYYDENTIRSLSDILSCFHYIEELLFVNGKHSKLDLIPQHLWLLYNSVEDLINNSKELNKEQSDYYQHLRQDFLKDIRKKGFEVRRYY